MIITKETIKEWEKEIDDIYKNQSKELEKLPRINRDWLDLDLTNELVKLTDKINELIDRINIITNQPIFPKQDE